MDNAISYRNGYIMADSNGTYSASYLNTATDRPYQALAGLGYGFESVEAARVAIDEAIIALESPIMRLVWRTGEYYHGWSVSGQNLHRFPALRRLAVYLDGWGYTMYEHIAEALGPVMITAAGARVITFTAADVDRVIALAEATQATETTTGAVCCDCGHTVPTNQVLNTGQGTACPDCYDRMSNGQEG